jgi:muconate cycloisomerase
MRIQSVEALPLRIPLKPAFCMVSALGRHDRSDYVLVRLSADNGAEGFGEATVMPRWSGETVAGAMAIIRDVFAPAVVGLDPADIEAVDRCLDSTCRHNWFAKAAIEMACWDLWGKSAGKPVYELLGGAVRGLRLRSRFSLGAYDLPRARQRAAELVAEGFDTIKVKVGGDPKQDVARVRAVREVIGDERALVIDANGGWDADTAIRCLRELESCRLELVEQPTPEGDFAAMARVRRETGQRLMADDGCFDLCHAEELIRQACCDVISVYPGKNGGIRKARQIVQFAEQHGVACTIGSNLEWDIATAAMAHLAVACENIRLEDIPGDMLGPSYHTERVVLDPLHIQGPWTEIRAAPGLGLQIDWPALQARRLALS